MENKGLKKQVSQSSAGILLVLIVVQKQRVFWFCFSSLLLCGSPLLSGQRCDWGWDVG